MNHLFHGIYEHRTVLVTGHTGFKGSWMSLWLQSLGARVVGFSLPPPTSPSNFQLTGLGSKMDHIQGDVRDINSLQEAVDRYRPEMVFHLAAQPLVLRSLEEPKETFDVNVGGTVNVLEACRQSDFVKALVVVTSDKCYDNQEWVWGYRETDSLGGADPYSASKAMAELAVGAYRRSRLMPGMVVATARAGNVIGGGDFAEHRLVPDCMKALIEDKPIAVRHPNSIRPWLHVLEPLAGYLWLGARLLEEGERYAEAWNFGPQEGQGITVREMVTRAIQLWSRGSWVDVSSGEHKEMNLLRLNWDKAGGRLGWRPVYSWEEALSETVRWYKCFEKAPQEELYSFCQEQIQRYVACAEESGVAWASRLGCKAGLQ